MATIRKLKNGHYEAIIYLGKDPTTGKVRKESKTFPREKEARTYATKIEGQRDDGLYRPTLSRATLGDYLRDRWLPTYKTQVRSAYTVEKVLGKWVLRPQPDTPFLGGIPIRKLTVADFDRLYTAMAQKDRMHYRRIQ